MDRKKISKNRRKTFGMLLLAAVLFLTAAFRFSMPEPAYAYESELYQYTVKVETGYLALRNAQSYNTKNEIGKLYTGETVVACPIESEKDGYRYVYSPKLHKLGYVNGNYLTNKRTYKGASKMYAKVETGYLALRNAKAYERENEIGVLYTGDPVFVLDDSDSSYWTVYAPTLSKAGYVNKNYLVSSGIKTDYNEPEVPAVIPPDSYADWKWESADSDILEFRMDITNYSRTKTVTDFEIIFYAEDVWGNRIYGDNSTVVKTTMRKTILPGETIKSDYIPMPDRQRIRTVYAAVRKARLSDGTICEYTSIPESAYGIWEVTQ